MRPRSNTLLVWTGAPCSYGCRACPIDAAGAPAAVQPVDLQRALASVPARPSRLAVLVGGEPFLRRDLLRLIAAIRAAGHVPGLVTTGGALVYPHVRERLRRAGVGYLRLQLFGAGAVHDHAAAVSGSFESALAGLRAWLAEAGDQCDVDVALCVRGRSTERLVSEIEQLGGLIPSPDVQLIVAVDHREQPECGRSESLCQAAAAPALAHWNEDPTRPVLVWEGLPESLLPGAYVTTAPLQQRFVAGRPHASCLGSVEEIERATAAHVHGVRANSFNFVRTATVVPWTAEAGACTAYQNAGDADPGRCLWLVEDAARAQPQPSGAASLVLHVTDTADFGRTEIVHIKDELSHLFIDCAPAGVLDDIKEGMRRVLPDPVCAPCPHRARCGRRFRVVDGPPFGREEAWIAKYVAALQGRVLDVGCGEQLYRDEIIPRVRSGIVEYHGLDPDEHSLASVRAVLPEGRYYAGGIEDFNGVPSSYDEILCLRSLNHVTDLDEALARMAELLKPGGRLLLVECTPFAMLRHPQQVAAADRAPRAGHQHFRNVCSEEVIPLARRRALRVVQHHPASLQTTNEWILLLEVA